MEVTKTLNRICAMARIKGVTPHTLWHTFASVAADLGFSELTIAGLLGHSALGVTQRYIHLDKALVVAADRSRRTLKAFCRPSNGAQRGPHNRAERIRPLRPKATGSNPVGCATSDAILKYFNKANGAQVRCLVSCPTSMSLLSHRGCDSRAPARLCKTQRGHLFRPVQDTGRSSRQAGSRISALSRNPRPATCTTTFCRRSGMVQRNHGSPATHACAYPQRP